MNQKQLILLLALVAVLGAAGVALHKKKSQSFRGDARVGQKLLGEFDVNAVKHISIRHNDQSVTLAYDGDKGWTVAERGNYPANFEQISEFVRKTAELKAIQAIQTGPSQWPKVELAPAGQGGKSGVDVVFKGQDGKAVRTFRLGAKHMKKTERDSPFGDSGGWPDGRYVLPEGSEYVMLVNDALTQAEPKPEQWLNKDFFKVEKIRSVAVTALETTNSWKAERASESGEWKLVDRKDAENVDTNKLSGLANVLSYPSFTDVVVGKKPEETGLDKATEIRIETFDRFAYVLKVGGKTPEDAMYTTVAVSADIAQTRNAGQDEKKEDAEKLDKEFKEKKEKLEEKLKREKALEGWVYVIPKWTLESLLKKRSELMVEEKKDEDKDKNGQSGDETSGDEDEMKEAASDESSAKKDNP